MNYKKVCNIYDNLVKQVEAINRHCNQGSKETKIKYKQVVKQYCWFVAENYGLQKLKNTKYRHVKAWTEFLKESKSPSTIYGNLSGLKFYLDQAGCNNPLPENEDLNLQQRIYVGPDRAWTPEEFINMAEFARKKDKHDIANIMEVAWLAGLRIHETLRLDRADIERASRKGILEVKGKGGLERDISLTSEAAYRLKEAAEYVERGQKLFIPPDKKTHQIKKSVQNFIGRHRDKFQQEYRIDRQEQLYMQQLGIKEYKTDITFHGLRHSFARSEYLKRVEDKDPRTARKEVAQLLGHGRDSVTKIYGAR